jgi:hypothetical protein
LLQGGLVSTFPTATYAGLPVLGFAAISYNNNVIVVSGKNVQSTYDSSYAHRVSTSVTTPTP